MKLTGPMNDSLLFRLRRSALLALSLPLLSACASYGKISNVPIDDAEPAARYSLQQAVHADRSDEATMVLAFSGGGTRAAALSYGVLEGVYVVSCGTGRKVAKGVAGKWVSFPATR